MLGLSIIFMRNPKLEKLDILNANWMETILGFSTLFISMIAMLVNISIFADKSLFALRQLEEYEKDKRKNKESVSFCEACKFLWKKNGARQIFIFYIITLTSLAVVLISGAFTAINLLKNLPAN